MKNIFLYSIIILNFYVGAQINLVSNPGFDNVSGTPNCASMPHGIGNGQNPNDIQTSNESRWSVVAPWTNPQQKPGICRNSSGSSDFMCSVGRNNTPCARVINGEFVCQPLAANLEIGKNYYVEFWVNGGANLNTTDVEPGLRFLEARPQQCGHRRLSKGNGPANIKIPSGSPESSWFKVNGYFVANKAYSWINIGLQNPNKKRYDKITPAPMSFFMDDFQIIDLGVGFCPTTNFIQNKSYSNIGEVIYRSQILTSSGNNVTNSEPNGNVNVASTASVTFNSETEIELNDGFAADEGSDFKAFITSCDGKCPSLSTNAGEDIVICGNVNTVQLGTTPNNGSTYLWSAIGQSNTLGHISLLSSTSIANPILNIPQNQIFVGNFQLTETDLCGKSSSDEIKIMVDPNPDPFPIIITFNSIAVTNNIAIFNVNMSIHTEEILVEVIENGNLIDELVFTAGDDFTPGSSSFIFTDSRNFLNCIDYTYVIRSKNFCYDAVSIAKVNSFKINPPNNGSVISVPNIFTPNNDGVNDCFAVNVQDYYQCVLDVFNAWGDLIHTNTYQLSNGVNCLWNGFCDNGLPHCTCNCLVSDGVYFYILKFKDCAGNTLETITGNVTKIGSPSQNSRFINQSIDSNSIESMSYSIIDTYKIFPNPNNGDFKLVFNSNSELPTLLTVVDSQGKVLNRIENPIQYEYNFSLKDINAGLYLINANYKNKIISQKFIVK